MTRTSSSTRQSRRRSPRKHASSRIFDSFSDEEEGAVPRKPIATPSPSKAVAVAAKRAGVRAPRRLLALADPTAKPTQDATTSPTSDAAPTSRAARLLSRGGKTSRRFALVMARKAKAAKKKSSSARSTSRSRTQKKRARSPGASRTAQRRVRSRKQAIGDEAQQEAEGVSEETQHRAQVLRMQLTSTLDKALPRFGALGGVPKSGTKGHGKAEFPGIPAEAAKWLLRNVAERTTSVSAPVTAYRLFVKTQVAKMQAAAHAAAKGKSKGKGKGKGKPTAEHMSPQAMIKAAAAAWKEATAEAKQEYADKAKAANDATDEEPIESFQVLFSTPGDIKLLAEAVLDNRMWQSPTKRFSDGYLGVSGLYRVCATFTNVRITYDAASTTLKAKWSYTITVVRDGDELLPTTGAGAGAPARRSSATTRGKGKGKGKGKGRAPRRRYVESDDESSESESDADVAIHSASDDE